LYVVKYFSGLLLIVMGSMDCLTTVLGTLYFGAQELNPLMEGIISASLPVFVIIKLLVTALSGLVFILAEKILVRNAPNGRPFRIARDTLRLVGLTVTMFLAAVVINNFIVIFNSSL